MARTLIATVVCRGLSGRVSGDFSTRNYPSGTKSFIWEVTQNGAANDRIVFSVKDNIKFGEDDYYLRNIKNGHTSKPFADRAVFIADPDGSANEDFTVQVYATDEA